MLLPSNFGWDDAMMQNAEYSPVTEPISAE